MSEVQTPECNVCNNGNIIFKFSKSGSKLLQCSNCNLVFVFPKPTLKEQKDWYEKSYADGVYKIFGDSTNLRYLVNEQRFQDISHHNLTGNILDIGTSTGIFLDVASKNGLSTFGVEFSSEIVKKINPKHKIFNGGLEKAGYPNTFFDTVTMYDVLEHLTDPDLVIQEISRIIKPEGLLVITTPDITSWHARLMGKNWIAIHTIEHLYYFSPKSLKELLEKHGFTICEIRKDYKKFTLQGIIDMASFYSPVAFKLFSFFKPIIPKFLLNRKKLCYFGDTFIVAKKL